MAQEIHFEIFKRVGAKGGWSMHDVSSSRDAALKVAEELMKAEKATGVKVIKETYNPETGDYLSLKIYEDGHTKMKVDKAAEDVPHAIPCFQPDDLYSYHARSTIARLLTDFLARNRWTVTELIHRADALEKLEATGTQFQHAIQKVAVAQAATTTTPVSQIVKSLNELATKSIHRVYRDDREKRFPVVTPGKFGALATKLAETPGPGAAYVLNGAIANHLRPAKAWDEKLALLLKLMPELPAEGKGRDLLLASIDQIAAEMLNGSAALHELIGEHENLGEALAAMVRLFSGNQAAANQGMTLLAQHFKADELSEARTAVANRILAEMKSVKRLSHLGVTHELMLLRQIANSLVLAQGKYLSHEDIIAAFTLRSKRLVAHEAIGNLLSDAKDVDEKIERLLSVEENIIGAENKRQLTTFLMPILQSNAFDAHFLQAKTPPLTRMQRLAELQARVRRSGFQDKERREISDLFDKTASEIDEKGKVLETIDSRAATNVERAQTLLRLFASNSITEGRLSAKAREIILGCLARPGFLTGYVAQQMRPGMKPDADAAMKELMATLNKAGITSETGLKNIAA
ncbi:MAG TPA: hypothetical protein VHL34_15505 [Rhizomicrobium sp.]|nr:hypothetical protein [Rhizomicrobium sp.]